MGLFWLRLLNDKPVDSQLGFGNLDRDSPFELLLVLSFLLLQSLRHELRSSGWLTLILRLLSRNVWNSGVSLSKTLLIGRVVNLTESSLLSSSATVDVMGQQFGIWVRGVYISLTIGVEGWFPKVSSEG